jgi:lipopolysaccharide biosynthesis glycosyltransferase
MNKTISVLYTTDDNGFNMLTVSMYSLLQNKNINTLVNIYIAHKKDFSGEHKEYCKKLCDIYKCNIFFIEMSQYEKEYDLEHIYKFVEFENARS